MPFMGIEHWTIAICDDDEIFLSRLEKQIRAELQQLNVVGELYHTRIVRNCWRQNCIRQKFFFLILICRK